MQYFVHDNFKIDIFLDTNILVDYVLGEKPILTYSIDFLNSKKAVRLRSSHYVEFELVEVLKIYFFYYATLGRFPSTEEKSHIKSNNWKIDGIEYAQKMQEVSEKVNQKMAVLESTFDRLFDDHVLHESLIKPACDLFLQSNISREDSLVTISSVYPNSETVLDFVALLSNDSQFCSVIDNNEKSIKSIMTSNGLNAPVMMNAKQLNCNSMKSHLNISEQNCDNQFIENFWNKMILELVKMKNKQSYIGSTYEFGKPNTISGECIYFNLEDTSTLKDAVSLLFFTNDAEVTISLPTKTKKGNLEFWNDNHPVTLPNDNTNDLSYSFKPLEGMLDPDEIGKLREPNNLVFYLNE
jgi:hypothetical protein